MLCVQLLRNTIGNELVGMLGVESINTIKHLHKRDRCAPGYPRAPCTPCTEQSTLSCTPYEYTTPLSIRHLHLLDRGSVNVQNYDMN